MECLDILIHKDSINIFNNVLNQFISKNNLKLVSLINDKHCRKYCMLGKNWGIQIDAFHESVFYKNQKLFRLVYCFLIAKRIIMYRY